MNASEFFYISLGVGVWVFVLVGLYIAYQVYITLRVIRTSIRSAKTAVKQAEAAKKAVEVGVLTVVSKVLGKLTSKK